MVNDTHTRRRRLHRIRRVPDVMQCSHLAADRLSHSSC